MIFSVVFFLWLVFFFLVNCSVQGLQPSGNFNRLIQPTTTSGGKPYKQQKVRTTTVDSTTIDDETITTWIAPPAAQQQQQPLPNVIKITDEDVMRFMQSPLNTGASALVPTPPIPTTESKTVDVSVSSSTRTSRRQQQQQKKNKSPPPPSTNVLVTIGCILALNSGFINGMGLSGFLGKKQAISAVTGTYTTSAIGYGSSGVMGLLGPFWMPLGIALCYSAGSLLNGILHPNAMKHVQDGKENFIQTSNTLVVAALLTIVANSLSNLFHQPQRIVFPILTFVMGLQNSWTSMLLNGNVLRTSHFSGITSDMGTILGQTIRGNYDNTWRLRIFTKLTSCFWFGGYLAYVLASSTSFNCSIATYCWTSAAIYLGIWSSIVVRSMVQLSPKRMMRRLRVVMSRRLRKPIPVLLGNMLDF